MDTNGFLVSSDLFGFVAAALTTFAFFPQVVKTWKSRKTDGLSIVMLIMFITGLIFWIIYAIQTKSIPVLIANIITLIFNLTILILKLIY
ncbi:MULTISPECIES: SemiSWEET transporter [Prochlorococcus]|uniref:SemiSWEET transporter n=1 Tax=Prochlorococcus TaxID=1218 RepID=UPI00056C35BC|nr:MULTISPECIES: SemiSWEET transporter [Prochlorococcus]